jgi:hypothetical protein
MALRVVLFLPLVWLASYTRIAAAANDLFVRRVGKSASTDAHLFIRNASAVKKNRGRKRMSGKVAIQATGRIETQHATDNGIDSAPMTEKEKFADVWYNGLGPDYLTLAQDPLASENHTAPPEPPQALTEKATDPSIENQKVIGRQLAFFAMATFVGVFFGLISTVIVPRLWYGLKFELATPMMKVSVLSNLLRALEARGAADWDSCILAKLLQKSLSTNAPFRAAARGREELEALLRRHGARPEILSDLATWQAALKQMQSELKEGRGEVFFLRNVDPEIRLQPGLLRVVRLLRVHFKAHTLAGERFLVAASRGSSIPWSNDMNIVLTGRVHMDTADIMDEVRNLVHEKLGLAAEWQSQYLERDAIPDCKLEVQPGKTFTCLQTCYMIHDVIMNVMCGSYKSADARMNVP